jgi:hypothetical protein
MTGCLKGSLVSVPPCHAPAGSFANGWSRGTLPACVQRGERLVTCSCSAAAAAGATEEGTPTGFKDRVATGGTVGTLPNASACKSSSSSESTRSITAQFPELCGGEGAGVGAWPACCTRCAGDAAECKRGAFDGAAATPRDGSAGRTILFAAAGEALVRRPGESRPPAHTLQLGSHMWCVSQSQEHPYFEHSLAQLSIHMLSTGKTDTITLIQGI